jgi:hypothetical protein
LGATVKKATWNSNRLLRFPKANLNVYTCRDTTCQHRAYGTTMTPSGYGARHLYAMLGTPALWRFLRCLLFSGKALEQRFKPCQQTLFVTVSQRELYLTPSQHDIDVAGCWRLRQWHGCLSLRSLSRLCSGLRSFSLLASCGSTAWRALRQILLAMRCLQRPSGVFSASGQVQAPLPRRSSRVHSDCAL